MTVRELIGGETAWIEPGDTVRHAAARMHEADIGALAVETDGSLQGIVTERDVLRACAAGADLDNVRVMQWMTPDPDSLSPEMSVDTAATWMLAAGYRHLPVVEDQAVIGVISIKDILWAITAPMVS